VGPMSRLRRDVSGETYLVNPDTLSSTIVALLEPSSCAMRSSRAAQVAKRLRAPEGVLFFVRLGTVMSDHVSAGESVVEQSVEWLC
jgi:hypothetical protein